MVHVENRLFEFLKFSDLPRTLRFFLADQLLEAFDILMSSDGLFCRQIQLTVQFADLAFQRERAMGIMFTPADDMTAHDFTGTRYELAVRIFFREFPSLLCVSHDIGVADVFVKMLHPLIEA